MRALIAAAMLCVLVGAPGCSSVREGPEFRAVVEAATDEEQEHSSARWFFEIPAEGTDGVWEIKKELSDDEEFQKAVQALGAGMAQDVRNEFHAVEQESRSKAKDEADPMTRMYYDMRGLKCVSVYTAMDKVLGDAKKK